MKSKLVKMLGIYLNLLAFIAPAAAARQGFNLFCRPFRGSVNKKQLRFLYSSERFTIRHEGQTIQGYRWGKGGKKILFLHGWQSHTYRWKTYVEALSKDDYTIYAIDAPGHGLSSGNLLTVPVYSALIENFIKEQNRVHTVVGHSLGSFSLLYTLYRLPELPVNRIILMAPPGEARDFVTVFQNTLGLSKGTVQLVIDYFAKRYDVAPDFFSTKKFVLALNIKGLIIHDEDDAEAPYHYSISLHQSWKNSRLITTKGLGHNLRSLSVVKEVVDFIDEPVQEPVVL
jgi:pimeloyl-ACP methyl ester carboxylesterase